MVFIFILIKTKTWQPCQEEYCFDQLPLHCIWSTPFIPSFTFIDTRMMIPFVQSAWWLVTIQYKRQAIN